MVSKPRASLLLNSVQGDGANLGKCDDGSFFKIALSGIASTRVVDGMSWFNDNEIDRGDYGRGDGQEGRSLRLAGELEHS